MLAQVRRRIALAGFTLLLGVPAFAQQPPAAPLASPPAAPAPAPAPQGTDNDPIVATVEGRPIRFSTVGQASDLLPENMRGMPFDTVYPVLLERIVDHIALSMMARRVGMDEIPQIRRQIENEVDRILEGAWLAKEVDSKITEDAIQDRYKKVYGGKAAIEQIRARHILVTTEAEANAVLAALRNGEDFATMAASRSRDPDGRQGGDLGFFRREQVSPSIADAVFAMQIGEISAKPIRNEFGWHVFKTEERRFVAPPVLADVRESIRQELRAQAVQLAISQARSQLTIRMYNLDATSRVPGKRTDPNAQ